MISLDNLWLLRLIKNARTIASHLSMASGVSEQIFENCLQKSLEAFQITSLKSDQTVCIRTLLVERCDVFAILPTGFGKSIIYQILLAVSIFLKQSLKIPLRYLCTVYSSCIFFVHTFCTKLLFPLDPERRRGEIECRSLYRDRQESLIPLSHSSTPCFLSVETRELHKPKCRTSQVSFLRRANNVYRQACKRGHTITRSVYR